MAQEKLQATIPQDNKWHTEDIEAKAKSLGIDKREFILKAVDMLMNFDNGFYQRIRRYSTGLKVPEYVVIQNMIINQIAKNSAETKVWGEHQKMLKEFAFAGEGENMRMITGEELFNMLEGSYIHEEKRKKTEREPMKELEEDFKNGTVNPLIDVEDFKKLGKNEQEEIIKKEEIEAKKELDKFLNKREDK